jgi:hypothetical protein
VLAFLKLQINRNLQNFGGIFNKATHSDVEILKWRALNLLILGHHKYWTELHKRANFVLLAIDNMQHII